MKCGGLEIPEMTHYRYLKIPRGFHPVSVRFQPPAPILYIKPFLVKLLKTFLIPLIFSLFLQPCYGLTDEEIQKSQSFLRDKPIGERIAFWAEKFIGIPYDTDPFGEYVSKATIVTDERVDCMYLTFRAV
jgi:hypothetical protein